MNDQEKIMLRIKKLQQHAESAKQIGSIAEAETFAQKAQEMMLEYNLTQMQIDGTKDMKTDEFAKWVYAEKVSYHDNQSGSRWRKELVGTLCQFNFCSSTINPKAHTFRVYGNMENVDVVIWMYHFLSTAFLRIAQEHHVALPEETRRMYNRYAYLKDFLLGAVAGLQEKLELQREKAATENNAVRSLMVLNKDSLTRYISKEVPNLKEGRKSKTVYVGSGYSDGVKVGRNYNIGGKVQNSTTNTTKKLN